MTHALTLNSTTNAHEIIVARTDAWHRLGIKVENCFSFAEGMQQIGMPEYAEEPLYDCVNGAYVPASDVKRIKRADGLLVSHVGNDYQLVQPSAVFSVADALVGNLHGAHYESLGSVHNGKKIFASLRLAELPNFKLSNGTSFATYLTAVAGYDGITGLLWYLSVIRAVCQNTITASVKNGSNFLKFKHTKKVHEKMDKIIQVSQNERLLSQNETLTPLQGVVDSLQTLQTRLDTWSQLMVTDKIFQNALEKLWPTENEKNPTRRKNLHDTIMQISADDAQRVPEEKGTLANLLNSIIEYADHYATARKTAIRADMPEDVRRAESALFGSGAKLKDAAMTLCAEIAPTLQRRVIVPVVHPVDKLVDMVEIEETVTTSQLLQDALELPVSDGNSGKRSLLDDILSLAD